MNKHSLPVGDHSSGVRLSQTPVANTDFTLPKFSGQPISVNDNGLSVSLGSTVGDDFVHNPHTRSRRVRRANLLFSGPGNWDILWGTLKLPQWWQLSLIHI